MKKRSDGRYIKQIYLGKFPTGEFDEANNPVFTKKYKAVYGSTKKEVEEKAFLLKQQVGKGIDINAANDKFKLWADRFLKIKKSEGHGYSYIKSIELFLKHLDSLNEIPISKIEVQNIRDIIIEKSIERMVDGKYTKPLSKRTLTGICQTAKQVFRLAIESRVLDYNPAEYVKIPKDAPYEGRTAIAKEQQQWIVETKHRTQLAAMIMLFAGLRRGEVGALTWKDIDLDRKIIHVNKAVEFINEQPHLKETKTKAGMRAVDIPNVLVSFLKEEKLKAHCIYVVHNRDGKMISRTVWRNIWRSYMKEFNMKYGYTKNQKIMLGINTDKEMNKNIPGGLDMLIETFTPHQLRHTFATNCYLAGEDVLTCMRWMGHTDVKTTLGIYTHLDATHKKSDNSRLDEFYKIQVNQA